jgi:hypothetical protein
MFGNILHRGSDSSSYFGGEMEVVRTWVAKIEISVVVNLKDSLAEFSSLRRYLFSL